MFDKLALTRIQSVVAGASGPLEVLQVLVAKFRRSLLKLLLFGVPMQAVA